MEEIMKKQNYKPSYSTPSPLSIHKDSQIISKAKPKIRIIHIFAPEIIKTDVANFRELVQRLTGKPTANDQKVIRKKKPRIPRRDHHQEPRDTMTTIAAAAAAVATPPAAVISNVISSGHDKASNNTMMNMNVDFCRTGFLGFAAETRERVKEEADDAEMWNNCGKNSCDGGGFLNGFADFDGFIQELGEFPLFPMDASSHHIHGFEESTQLA